MSEKKRLPVPMDKQREVKVNYAIAKFMKKGIAFKSKAKPDFNLQDNNSRCWIKYYPDNKEFHITLRFAGTDYITGEGDDNFDIDLYLPWEEFNNKFQEIKEAKEVEND